MRKRLLPLLILCLMLLRPFPVGAATSLDTGADASLTLCYQKDRPFSDLPISIHRVAQAFPDGTFELIGPYATYPVNIHDITMQEQWTYIAVTLSSYIVAEHVQPDRVSTTDANGAVSFQGLQTGLYLVREVIAEDDDGTYVFAPFLVYLPTPQADGSFDYDVEARPKCTDFTPKTTYTVTKLWQDAGDRDKRPDAVTVDIYQDGQLHSTQALNADNDWTYSWSVPSDDSSIWTVTERNVPEGYKVTIRQNGSNFSIINTSKTLPNPPQTGDTFTPLPWILIMCFAGIGLLIVGIYGRRREC